MLNLAQRQLKLRYRRSILGWLWSLITPLASLVTYTVVFGIFLRVSPPLAGNDELRSFSLFLFCGLIAWNLFSSVVSGSILWLLELGPLLKKVAVPPAAPLFGGAVAFLVQTGTEVTLLIVILAALGNISLSLLTLPVTILLLALFSIGIGMLAALTNVYLRDVENAVRISLTVLFYATPIVYPLEVVPEEIWGGLPLRTIVEWNPLTSFVEAFRGTLYALETPSFQQFLILLGAASASLASAMWVFRRFGTRLSEEL